MGFLDYVGCDPEGGKEAINGRRGFLMKVLDLFSGIGGFSLGLERAGMETVAFCEIDPYCRKILEKHWPTVPIHSNVKNLNGEKYEGEVDLICGGFPCQPFSQAGKQGGTEDDRYLWPEMLRLIREIRPSWMLGENVTGIINMELDKIISSLEEENYKVGTYIIPACGVDAPHKRNRVWIVAHTNSPRQFASQREGSPRDYIRRGREAMADSLASGSQGRLLGRQDKGRQSQHGYFGCNSSIHRQPCPSSWTTEPGIRRVVNGIPNRVDRIKGLGNAVVPQIVEVFGNMIMEAC